MTPDSGIPRRPAATRFFRRFVFFCFLLSFVFWLGSLLHFRPFGSAAWAEDLFPALALATTLAAAVRSLPVQNVILVAVLIALIAGAVESVSAKTGIPFGPFTYTDDLGPQLFGILPWPVPVMWVLVVLNARGVARLILRPWRKISKYGFWAMGLTCALAVIFDFGLEPFATQVNHYWIWHAPANVPAWHTAPWVNFVGWATTTLLILAFTTPWLINKRPVRHAPPEYHPLIVWLLLNLLLATGNAAQHFWLAAGFSLAAAIVTAIFAWRGARW